MRFYALHNWILKQFNLKPRLQMVCMWYVLSLMVETRKHSLEFAACLSGLNKSQFCRMLNAHGHIAAYTFDDLSKRQANQFAQARKHLPSLPWQIAILIDAVVQTRSSLHAENVQKFDHGQGFVIGHQWTNIVLMINDVLIPLPPIPFYTKSYCRKIGKPYLTEHERVVEYLKNLDLIFYLGPHTSQEVVVIADAGYDDKKIQKAILEKGWHFLIALKNTRSVKSQQQYQTTPKSTHWHQIEPFFKDQRRLAWQTVRILKDGPKRKRMDFRIRHISGALKGVGEVQLICSQFKKRPDGRRKYIACSDLKAKPRQILIGYRLRWRVETFHKAVKMHLGFEDVATSSFDSVFSHVQWVYCAYLLLQAKPPGMPDAIRSIPHKQHYILHIIQNKDRAQILQLLTQIGGVDKHKEALKSALAAA